MKRKITLLLAAVFLFALTGCAGSAENDPAADITPSAEQTDTADLLGVTLTVKDVTATGLTIVCTQSGGEPTGELSTGSWYRIDRLDNGEWTALDYAYDGSQGEVAWTSEAWLIAMNGTSEWQVNWEWLYGQLQPDTYRIAKEIMDFRLPGDFDQYCCYAEFVIE